MHLFLSENPRSLYLATSSQDERRGCPPRVLIFRAAQGSSSQAVVEFLPRKEVDLSNAIKLTSRIVKGCLGLVSIANDMFLAVIVSATEVGNTRPSSPTAETVAQIHDVGFFCLTSSAWDDLSLTGDTGFSAPGYGDQADMYMREHTASGTATPAPEHPCTPLRKIISAGTFYYASEPQWDISSRLQRRLARNEPWDAATYDDRFVWNEFIVKSLLDFRDRLDAQERAELDQCQFIVLAIQGYVGVCTLALPAPPTNGTPIVATISLISRLGWKRAGTRFNTRGVDDDGNCANFVETETIFSTDQHCYSYVQVRGSVPLFWEQQGLQTFGQRIQITRPQASQPAFDRHFAGLVEEYGAVHSINLLGTKENEAILTAAYARHMQVARQSVGDTIGITNFDFHTAVKYGGHESVFREIRRIESIVDNIDRFGFAMADASTNDIITEQKGIFRTNCLDCLDRTNFVQDILSRTSLEQYLKLVRREWIQSSSLWSNHGELWAENGDALSRIYAGTGALNTSFTRSGKRTLAGVLSDATKSVSRAYINNFQDKGKQVAIDMFVGNLSTQRQVTIFDPIHDSVRAALEHRLAEYSTTKQCTIFVGTWNLNGRPPASESLLPWLFPRPNTPDPDILALGFQEIVPLTAQQIVQTDPEKRSRMWEAKIIDTLERRPNKKNDYILLRSHQLVGTALLVLVKKELTAVIRNVEAASHKTGLRGMSGNKGAVGIRLEYYDTTFCFITAHLAAGHSNVVERNADYRTIVSGLHFLKGKTIDSHQNIIWLADTNYRIDLDNERVRTLALMDDFDALLAADQLRRAMDDGEVFHGFQEGPLLFRPTYKYDLNSDSYDTGEKLRIPAWTDRVLFKGNNLDLAVYSRAELKCSDHRPVFALFRAEVRIIDHAKRATLQKLLLENVTSTAPGEKLDEKLASLTFTPEEHDLPPPSSDESAWWDDLDHPNGIVIPVSRRNGSQPRSSNPFESSSESSLSSSPSSSEEELYHALSLQAPITPAQPAATTHRRPPPPPPTRVNKPSADTAETTS
ncbi:inositol polyphosphate phosphatase [Earliella scabrosa]|nr:inositol polyphosphate phosphatase [Earliella scabrosa]